jgi:hypothetical protein
VAAVVEELPPAAPVAERSSSGPPVVRSNKRTAYRTSPSSLEFAADRADR